MLAWQTTGLIHPDSFMTPFTLAVTWFIFTWQTPIPIHPDIYMVPFTMVVTWFFFAWHTPNPIHTDTYMVSFTLTDIWFFFAWQTPIPIHTDTYLVPFTLIVIVSFTLIVTWPNFLWHETCSLLPKQAHDLLYLDWHMVLFTHTSILLLFILTDNIHLIHFLLPRYLLVLSQWT